MLKTTALPTVKKKMGNNKLVLGFAALIASAIVGTTGFAAAQTQNQTGTGYGGNTVNMDIDVRGDNNVINVIIRLVSGR